VDAEERQQELMEQNEMQGLMFKVDNDPRIIGSEKGPGKGIGNFIRKTSMDEFPQFWNVLKGDMSLVGTRPPTKTEYENYALHHKIRLSMKPGITGLWQVSGRNDITNFEKVVELDTAYIENWTLILDIKILFMTIGAVVSRKGSK
jgi:lipopolysaccharide/colanic/teichoic acid biosynthesis glycosyltransferase